MHNRRRHLDEDQDNDRHTHARLPHSRASNRGGQQRRQDGGRRREEQQRIANAGRVGTAGSVVGELDHDRAIENRPGEPGRCQRVLEMADLDVVMQELAHQGQQRARIGRPPAQRKGREPERDVHDRRDGEEQQRRARRAAQDQDRRHRRHDRHASAPLHRRSQADQHRAREHASPGPGRHRHEKAPQDQAGQAAVEQRRARVGQEETVTGEERGREPARPSIHEQRGGPARPR